jgi:hypothetical protein
MPRYLARSPVNIPDSVHPLLLPERRVGLRGHARRDRSDRQGAVGSDGPAPEPRAGVRAVTARERGGPAWSGRRRGVRDADARHMISVTRRYAVGRRGALSRGSRPHSSHWDPYRCCPRRPDGRPASSVGHHAQGREELFSHDLVHFKVLQRDHPRAGLSVHGFESPRRPTVPDGIDQ